MKRASKKQWGSVHHTETILQATYRNVKGKGEIFCTVCMRNRLRVCGLTRARHRDRINTVDQAFLPHPGKSPRVKTETYADVVELVDSLDLGAVTSVKVFLWK